MTRCDKKIGQILDRPYPSDPQGCRSAPPHYYQNTPYDPIFVNGKYLKLQLYKKLPRFGMAENLKMSRHFVQLTSSWHIHYFVDGAGHTHEVTPHEGQEKR